MRSCIDIDAQDDEGNTPLIYAACFGKLEIAQALIAAGAKVDVQDARGWTPLMWATTNHHALMAKCLLEHGADAQTRSARGRTVFDFVKHDTMAGMLAGIPSLASSQNVKFDWAQCRPDQMFVFVADDLPLILDTISQEGAMEAHPVFLPAHVIFLCARFAHHYLGLAERVIQQALERIQVSIQANTENVSRLAYWLSNMTRLLYCLKKDQRLVTATAQSQLSLSELISESYVYIVQDTEKRLTAILEPALLEFVDPLLGMEATHVANDWSSWFFRKKPKVPGVQRNSGEFPNPNLPSPETLTRLLSRLVCVLEGYEVHPSIVLQALAQFFHFVSCESFNRILTQKKYLSRSKAIQLRMNLSVLEEWIRHGQLPLTLLTYLTPVIQLVQFLQCVSQLDSPEAIEAFDALNPPEIHRCILNYRYEANEPRIIQPFGNPSEKVKEQEAIKDSRRMLPFSIPTTAQLAFVHDHLTPTIPPEAMAHLNKSK
ncbi:hypothetical protein BY458DRAFT_430039 [Sporodiniella umbellata]|nr:hypothetical protein BY458DRAFT_430039 [Sporodiniella umbellata]